MNDSYPASPGEGGSRHEPAHEAKASRRNELLVGLVLTAAVLGVYAQVVGFEFVDADDQSYITQNVTVQGGVTLRSIQWAFTTGDTANWHPVTWLSHLLDIELFGMWAGGHHTTNVLLHLLNTLLLFHLLRRMTSAVWPSAFVAALFAVHPMHVESVAWISERKDVLSTAFGLAAIWAYLAYVAGSSRAYLGVCLALALSLMSKPMLVTLPFLLLLLDYWPLARYPRTSFRQLVSEKLPLFAIVAASCVATIVAQRAGGAVRSIEIISLGERIANAVVSYVLYALKTAWPVQLSILYPHPYMPDTGGTPLASWEIAGAFAALLAFSLWVLWLRRPYALVGWLWYLGTLVPVIGLLQVGNQALADRYSYLPSVGLFIMLAWGGAELAARLRARARWAPPLLAAVACAVLLVYAALAWQQTRVWRDSVTLFEHALEVTPRNSMVHSALAATLVSRGLFSDAERHSRLALEIKPQFVAALSNLGNALRGQGRHEQAARLYRQALAAEPNQPTVRCNLANALSSLRRLEEAIVEYERSLEIDPSSAACQHNLGNALFALNRLDEANSRFEEALRLNPRFAIAHYMMGQVSEKRNRMDEAIAHYRAALKIDPTNSQARYYLDRASKSEASRGGSR